MGKNNYLLLVFCALFSLSKAQSYGWIPLGTGGQSLHVNNTISTICADAGGNIYASGNFTNSTGKPYVVKWDGNNWTQLGNWNSLLSTQISANPMSVNSICTDKNGNIYAAGVLLNQLSSRIFVAKWDGNSWINLGDNSAIIDNEINSICVDKFNNVYAAGYAQNNSQFTYVAKWDGSSWSELGQIMANNVIYSVCTDTLGYIYAAGKFTDGTGYPYVAKWDGTNWSNLGGLSGNTTIWSLCVDPYGNVYAGTDHNILKYSLGNPGPSIECPSGGDQFFTLCSDFFGNIYGGGNVTLPNNQESSVMQLRGANCQELPVSGGILFGNGDYINSICTDTYGNLYAADVMSNLVTKYEKILSVSLDTSVAICAGSLVTLNPVVTGLFPPYHYNWFNISGDPLSCNNCKNPSSTITQNSTYRVVVTDSLGDTASATIIYSINGLNNSMSLSLLNKILVCGEDSTILTLNGANLPYRVNWGDGTVSVGVLQSSLNHNYQGAGLYLISISDSNQCVISQLDSVIFYKPGLLLSRSMPSGCLNSGELEVTLFNGALPYTFNWSNGDTSAIITHLQTGNYFVTAVDSNGCSVSASYDVPQGVYYVFLSGNDANCGTNGSVASLLYGGIPPYTYAWSTGSNSTYLNNLHAGNYYLTVTDSTGCLTIGNVHIDSNCLAIITGVVFKDSDQNCVFDSLDVPCNGHSISVSSNQGHTFSGLSDWDGQYKIAVSDIGVYIITSIDNNTQACNYFVVCDSQNNPLHVLAMGDTLSNVNIAFTNATFDLAIHPGWSAASPGFPKSYWIYFYNKSNLPVNTPVTIYFHYDSVLIYDSSATPYTTYAPAQQVLTWTVNHINNSPNLISSNYIGPIYFSIPSNVPPNHLLQSDFRISPNQGDCDTLNNFVHFTDTIKGAHDPNYKMVLPSGSVSDEDSVLTYTIHFQNTGNDSTNFIIIKDTLSPFLEATSVSNQAASHNFSAFDISSTGVLTWIFSPLHLVDSATNFEGSQGFIVFSIKKKAGLLIGTKIANNAAIYFDYNSPVLTAPVIDTVICKLLQTLAVNLCSGDLYHFNDSLLADPGIYSRTVITSTGCDSTTTLTLNVMPKFTTSVYDTILVGDSVVFNSYWLTQAGIYQDTLISSIGCDSIITLHLSGLTSLQNGAFNKWFIFPNPTSGYLNIISSESAGVSFRLMDINGEVVLNKTKTDSGFRYTIDLSDNSAGIYILEIQDIENVPRLIKIVKE